MVCILVTLLVAEQGEDGAMGRGCWSNQGSTEQPGVELRGERATVVAWRALRGRQKLEVRTDPEDLRVK